jgi:hypothetical protein
VIAMASKAQKYISKKIEKLRKEGKSGKQAAGQAYGMARGKGMKVPKKGGKR